MANNHLTQDFFVQLNKSKLPSFCHFIKDVQDNYDEKLFHPHSFDYDTLCNVVHLAETGFDEYWLLYSDDSIVSYGILRGWSEGYIIPSIGIIVSPKHRKRGYGKDMMLFLHSRAIIRGANKIRLTVYKKNITAINLYQRLGYSLQNYSDSQLIGFLDMDNKTERSLYV